MHRKSAKFTSLMRSIRTSRRVILRRGETKRACYLIASTKDGLDTAIYRTYVVWLDGASTVVAINFRGKYSWEGLEAAGNGDHTPADL